MFDGFCVLAAGAVLSTVWKTRSVAPAYWTACGDSGVGLARLRSSSDEAVDGGARAVLGVVLQLGLARDRVELAEHLDRGAHHQQHERHGHEQADERHVAALGPHWITPVPELLTDWASLESTAAIQ